jgi:hypothetical protein
MLVTATDVGSAAKRLPRGRSDAVAARAVFRRQCVDRAEGRVAVLGGDNVEWDGIGEMIA